MLRRAQEELDKQELRMKQQLQELQKQRDADEVREVRRRSEYEQKLMEASLLQTKVRLEAKEVKQRESAKAEALARQVAELETSLRDARERLKRADDEFDKYRHRMRATPEAVLREENATLKAQLAERTAEIERQRRLCAEKDLQTEHYRAQMYSLARALKIERAKSSDIARQEMEQLRLEFLAREER